METERIALSQEERDRLQVLRELEQGAIKAGCGGAADEINRPSGAPVAAALAKGRRQGGDPQVAGSALESEVRWFLAAEGFGSRRSALCRLRAHAGRRALGPGRVTR